MLDALPLIHVVKFLYFVYDFYATLSEADESAQAGYGVSSRAVSRVTTVTASLTKIFKGDFNNNKRVKYDQHGILNDCECEHEGSY